MSKVLLVVCMIVLSLSAKAQHSYPIDSVAAGIHDTSINREVIHHLREYQTEKATHYRFDSAKWKKVVGNTNFIEEEEKLKQTKPSTPKSFDFSWTGPVAQLVSYSIIGGLIILLFYFVFKNMTWGFKPISNEVNILDSGVPVKDIDELNLDALLKKALADGNFRMAIRLYYLGVLRTLNTSGKIIWKKDKTNRDYLGELFAKSYYFDEVRRLTLAYEQVWYGEHTLTPEAFQRLKNNFESLDRQIKTS